MWHSIESSKYMPTIGTQYDLIQSPRSERSDKVFDSSVLYQITTMVGQGGGHGHQGERATHFFGPPPWKFVWSAPGIYDCRTKVAEL